MSSSVSLITDEKTNPTKTMNHQLAKWDPIKELNQVGNRLSSFFSKVEDLPPTGLEISDWSPQVDISEDDNEYLIVADLPEVNKDEVKVGLENGNLSISGERKSESEEKDEKRRYHRVERSYGSYQRTFHLPENIEKDKVEAEFNEGVLRVHLPKRDTKPEKMIPVQ